jgi:hypothetical protein
MDVREQGLSWLWIRIKASGRRKTKMKHAMNAWIKSVKKAEKDLCRK